MVFKLNNCPNCLTPFIAENYLEPFFMTIRDEMRTKSSIPNMFFQSVLFNSKNQNLEKLIWNVFFFRHQLFIAIKTRPLNFINLFNLLK